VPRSAVADSRESKKSVERGAEEGYREGVFMGNSAQGE